MNKDQAQARIKELSKIIEQYNHQYYVLDESTISDMQYDALMDELISLESEHPDLKSNQSPTQRVGTKVDSTLPTVTHAVKMYSLDNTYNLEELKSWYDRVVKGLDGKHPELVCELKMDGVSASLTYTDGKYTLGATRGDGLTGENITHNLATIKSVPLTLKTNQPPEALDVRAEVYLSKSNFEKLNQTREENSEAIFANPRNATSGSVKLLDSRITAKRGLQLFIHSFGQVKGMSFKSQWDFLETIKDYGFAVNPTTRLCKNLEDVISYCQEFEAKRDDLNYDVDGVVIKVNDFNDQDVLGFTQKSPRWAVAFKFAAQEATSDVKSISVQVGRTGVLTPVANLEPVACGGVTISRATLHNFDEINRLKLNVNDTVLVKRSGDVIPKIVKVLDKKSKGTFNPPTQCPECDTDVFKDESGAVVQYRCINPSCSKLLERSLIHFASRGAMDIEGLGESVVAQLTESNQVKSIADIYRLTKEDLLKLELFKDKKADNLLESISKSKLQPLSRLLFGLGIANIGAKAASLLASRFKSLDGLIQASEQSISDIHELGEISAQSVVKFFKQDDVIVLVKALKELGLNLIEPDQELESNNLEGTKFVFTGELNKLTRSEAKKMVEANGGAVSSSVSKNTDYVVAGEAAGSKYQKALDLGVSILSEEEFLKLVS